MLQTGWSLVNVEQQFLDETFPRNPLQAQQLLRLIFVSAYKQANNDSQ